MAFVAPGLLIRHYVQTDDSVPRLFDAYYSYDLDLSPEQYLDAVQYGTLAARDGMATALQAWLAMDSRYLGCTGHLYTDSPVIPWSEINFAGAVGELEGDTCPDYVSAVVRRYSAQPGPSGRGRAFIPAVAEINTDTSRLNGDGETALAGIRDALSEPLDVDAHVPDLIFSPAHWKRKSPPALAAVIVWVNDPTLVTQRRRRLRPLQ